jgi:hypothetical protein
LADRRGERAGNGGLNDDAPHQPKDEPHDVQELSFAQHGASGVFFLAVPAALQAQWRRADILDSVKESRSRGSLSATAEGRLHSYRLPTNTGVISLGTELHHSFAPVEPVATELLDNDRCQAFLPQLTAFENRMFGRDFACGWDQTKSWLRSGCSLYAAIRRRNGSSETKVVSLISAFITTGSERERLLNAEIPDYELLPWSESPSDEPTVYFSSVISDTPAHLRAMYGSLLRDLSAFRDAHRLRFHDAFAIASGTSGRRHLARNGFRALPGKRYLRKYDLMSLNKETAATPFWSKLLEATK